MLDDLRALVELAQASHPTSVRVPLAEDGLHVNLGTEWRKERSSLVPNYALQAGLATDSFAVAPVGSDFTISEIFSEMRLPLATHQRLADDLSLDAGYRYSRYSSGFDTHTYKLGLQWAPVPDARLRVSYQRAVRAPNINEFYSLQSLGGEYVVDSCEGRPSTSLAASARIAETHLRFQRWSPAAELRAVQNQVSIDGRPERLVCASEADQGIGRDLSLACNTRRAARDRER